jgi:hypothetical protein
MKTIKLNVEGIPEPFVHAVRKMVDDLRDQLRTRGDDRPPVELPVWPGKVFEPLTRDEIYEDVD